MSTQLSSGHSMETMTDRPQKVELQPGVLRVRSDSKRVYAEEFKVDLVRQCLVPEVDCGRVAKDAEFSTATVGACDEPVDAVGNSGRTRDFILRGQLHRRQCGLVLFIGGVNPSRLE